jgi:hypothetical protein
VEHVSFPFAGLPIGDLGAVVWGAAVPDATASGTDASIVGRWRDAERRLYPLVLSAPELYERSLVLVRAAADELRAIDDGAQLVARFPESEQLVLQAAQAAGLPVAGVDLAAVAGAAFALRHGELEAAATQLAARNALAAARTAGVPWATLREDGRRMPDGEVVPPYHVIEAATSKPVGLHAYAIFDMTSGTVSYGVQVLGIDESSGRWWVDEASAIPERTHDDAQVWQRSRQEIRDLLLGDAAG